ncbi:IclR family transcriptional regulator domain-containing protein [Catenulispora rubra]|uniref:IclR family transcriptional regulator domain-containing protein n=1 Tax=Catenulispora rubra TaxID=280293 RepID=UPI0018920559|nr:IclR family transcriptional regulator C-terminal domain-containing protein [Catenulispora rubra]
MSPTAADTSVGPLERGLAVLRTLALAPGGRMRTSDLARATGLARSPVDRIATTLLRLGYLRDEGDRELALAPRVLELGLAYLRAGRLAERLGPLAETLADEIDESVSLAVPDGDAVRFVVQTPRRRALSVTFRAGDALPAERCAPGFLFAAEWDEPAFERWQARMAADPEDASFPALGRAHRQPRLTAPQFRALAAAARDTDWALDDQLIESGLVAMAVPVRDVSGYVVAALSVVSHSSRHSAASLHDHVLKRLHGTARQMTAALEEPEDRHPGPVPSRDDSLDPKQELGPEYLQSLARGLSVLAALSTPGGMTLTEVADATALPRATARRSLLTLEQLGYVALDGRRFTPLPRVLDLGYPTVSARPLADLVQPHLVELVHRVHESASVAVLDGPDIRYIARVAASRIMRVEITVGTRFPAYATSMGRVLLAALTPEQRAAWLAGAELAPLTSHTVTDPARLEALLTEAGHDGFAIADEELEEGVRSIAVPVRGPDGRVVAAVNIALPAGRTWAVDMPRELLPAIRETASRISEDVGLAFALKPSAVH